MDDAHVTGGERPEVSRWRLRDLVETGDPTLGGWCAIPSALTAEVMAGAGFDWVCLDMQHGLIGYEAMLAMLQALDGYRTPALVRVPWNEPSVVMRTLDAGADGVIVPMVNSRAEAEAAVRAARYPPLGFRSWGPIRASLGDAGYSPESANRGVVCLVMAETVEAMEQLDEILAVPGVDGVFAGPWDLSLSVSQGTVNPAGTTREVELLEAVAAACERRGLVAGIACGAPEDAGRWWGAGYRLCSISSDVALLGAGASATVAAARAALQR